MPKPIQNRLQSKCSGLKIPTVSAADRFVWQDEARKQEYEAPENMIFGKVKSPTVAELC